MVRVRGIWSSEDFCARLKLTRSLRPSIFRIRRYRTAARFSTVQFTSRIPQLKNYFHSDAIPPARGEEPVAHAEALGVVRAAHPSILESIWVCTETAGRGEPGDDRTELEDVRLRPGTEQLPVRHVERAAGEENRGFEPRRPGRAGGTCREVLPVGSLDKADPGAAQTRAGELGADKVGPGGLPNTLHERCPVHDQGAAPEEQLRDLPTALF